MYKVTSRTTIDNSNLKVFNKEYDEYMISIQQQVLEGLAKEMYENNCIAIERIESNTSNPNNITYTVTGYVITKEEIDKAIELLVNIKFGPNRLINDHLNQLYDILTKEPSK